MDLDLWIKNLAKVVFYYDTQKYIFMIYNRHFCVFSPQIVSRAAAYESVKQRGARRYKRDFSSVQKTL